MLKKQAVGLVMVKTGDSVHRLKKELCLLVGKLRPMTPAILIVMAKSACKIMTLSFFVYRERLLVRFCRLLLFIASYLILTLELTVLVSINFIKLIEKTKLWFF